MGCGCWRGGGGIWQCAASAASLPLVCCLPDRMPSLPTQLMPPLNHPNQPWLTCSFPGLEREAEQKRSQLPWAAVTLYDPLLQPVRRRFFGQTEEGDLVRPALDCLFEGWLSLLPAHSMPRLWPDGSGQAGETGTGLLD